MSAFPADLLDLQVEIFVQSHWERLGGFQIILDDVYTNVYTDVYPGRAGWNHNRLVDQAITITHGRADMASDVVAATTTMRFRNDDGWLTSDDPRSPWWPDVSIGTQMRITVDGDVILWGEINTLVGDWPHDDQSHVDDPIDLTAAAGAGDDLGFGYVDITVSGILHRLSQGQPPLRSTIYRCVTSPANLPHVSDYWPMEDGTLATFFASGFPNGYTMAASGLTFANDSALLGSEPLPTVPDGQSGTWSAPVVGVADSWSMDLFHNLPAAPGDGSSSVVIDINTSGSHATWRIIFGNTGDPGTPVLKPYVSLVSFASNGAVLVSHTVIDPQFLFGHIAQMTLKVENGGAGINWSLEWSYVSEGLDAVRAITGTATGTAGRPFFIRATVTKAPSGGVTFGHVLFRDNFLAPGWLVGPDVGWAGEQALDRVIRLSNEEQIPLFTVGSNPTALMGPQKPDTYLNLIRECAASDGALLCEARTLLALVYRTGRSRYNQPVDLILDAAGRSQLANPFTPTVDDLDIRNTITVQQANGPKITLVDAESAKPPWAGDGPYEESVTLSLFSGHQIRDQAGWRRHLGTWFSKTRDLPSGSKYRYPQASIDIATADADVGTFWGGAPILWGGVPTHWGLPQSLSTLWKARRVGNRIQIIDLLPQHPIEGPIDQILEGWSDTLSPTDWTVTPHLSPAGPWTVATWGTSRYCAQGRTLRTAIDATQTSFDVSTNGGIAWTTDPAHFPFQVRVGKVELMTVTNIGAASGGYQTFTAIRNVNRFGRPHPAGSPVNVWPESILGL